MGLTLAELTELLRVRGLRLKRSLGQSFLVDPNFIEAIVRDAEIGPGDGVVEIGAGAGALTDRLAAQAARVWAFEVDPGVHGLAAELLAGRPNLSLILADGADFERHVAAGEVGRLKVVSNLPYEPWKRLLLRLLSTRLPIEAYTLMLQKDVVDRLRAAPGSRSYGPMSVVVQATCEIKVLRRASGGLFLPRAGVESEVFRLTRRRVEPDLEGLEKALQQLFAGRRKKSPAAGGRRIESLLPKELLDIARAAKRTGPFAAL
jgi:16S rRNA (adenine1518-N6/adenine1519-N6)-dimethyltransferase